MPFRRFPLAVLLAVLLAGCNRGGTRGALFDSLSPDQTGVAFENTLAETAAMNIISYLYYFNGGGVAAGDVDGDGLPDLYFTGNEVPNRLYLNRTEPGGALRFEDVTEAAGVAGTSDWTTGVTMADVDGDGRLDLYVSALGGVRTQRGRNELFLNEGAGPDGVPVFREAAAEVGLGFEGFGTQAAFLDYDRRRRPGRVPAQPRRPHQPLVRGARPRPRAQRALRRPALPQRARLGRRGGRRRPVLRRGDGGGRHHERHFRLRPLRWCRRTSTATAGRTSLSATTSTRTTFSTSTTPTARSPSPANGRCATRASSRWAPTPPTSTPTGARTSWCWTCCRAARPSAPSPAATTRARSRPSSAASATCRS